MSERPIVTPGEVAGQAAGAGGELEHPNGAAQGETVFEFPEAASLNRHDGVSGGELQLPEELAQKYDHLEARVVKTKNGSQRRIYGIDENGKNRQLKADDVLAAYGYGTRKEEAHLPDGEENHFPGVETDDVDTGQEQESLHDEYIKDVANDKQVAIKDPETGKMVKKNTKDLNFRQWIKQRESRKLAKWYGDTRAHAEAPDQIDVDAGPTHDEVRRTITKDEQDRLNAQESRVAPSEDDVAYYRWLKNTGQAEETKSRLPVPLPRTPEPTPEPTPVPESPESPEDGSDDAPDADPTAEIPSIPENPTDEDMNERRKSIWKRAKDSLANIRKAGFKGSVIAAQNSVNKQIARTKEYFTDEEKGKRRQVVAGVIGVAVVAGGAYLATKGVPFTGSSAEKANELELTQDQLNYIEGGLEVQEAHPELSGQELIDRLENTSDYAAKVNELRESGVAQAEIEEMARRWFEESEDL